MKLVYKIVQQHSLIKEQERLDSIFFSKYRHVYFWAGRRTVYTRKRTWFRISSIQRGGPSSPALAARASFCWMWYS